MSDTHHFHVIWGKDTLILTPGLGRSLTRWERFVMKAKAPFWRLRYAAEDLNEVAAYRVKGAWRVLIGRSSWY